MQKPGLNQQNLENILRVLLKEMQEKKLLPGMSKEQEDALVQTVSKKITESGHLRNFNFDMRDNPESIKNVMTLLKLSLASEFKQNKEINPDANPKLKFDYTKLFKNEMDKNELKMQLKMLMSQLNNQASEKMSEKDIDDFTEQLSEKIAQDMEFNEKKQVPENNKATDALTTMLTSLYGLDPRLAGARPVTVATIAGNAAGLTNYNQGDANAMSFMAEQNRVDVGKTDYTGQEARRISNAVSAGSSMSDALESAISQVSHPSPNFKMDE